MGINTPVKPNRATPICYNVVSPFRIKEIWNEEGGKALGGFLSGFAGDILGGFARGLQNVCIPTKTVMIAIAGGTASVLGGGKFPNGAMSAAFVFMFNEMAGYPKKFIKVSKENIRNNAVRFYMQRYNMSRTDAIVKYEWAVVNDAYQMRMMTYAASLFVGGVAGRAGYYMLMRNPWMIEFGIDTISSALPATAPASSYGGAVGFFGSMGYEYYRNHK